MERIYEWWLGRPTHPVKVDVVQAIVPKAFDLRQNYPNPFNPTTTIEYELPEPTHVRIDIYDLLGRHVRTIVDSKQIAGYFRTAWDSTDKRVVSAAAGIYFCRMQANNFVKVIKLALVR